MHYYIDGYNLLFRIIRAGDKNLKYHRQKLILDLNEKIQFLKLDATIVFDSKYHFDESTRSHFNHLEILFSDEGMTADEMILRELKASSSPRQEIIITSDRELAWQARRLSAKTESVEEFLSWLDKRFKKRKKEIVKKEWQVVETPAVSIQDRSQTPFKPGKTPEESFDYYLIEFEKKFEEILKEESEQKPTLPAEKQKKRKKTEATQEQVMSDEERWLKIFEERSKNQEN